VKVVQVDLDPEAVGARRSVDLGVIGDAGEVAQAVTTALSRRETREAGRNGEVGYRSAALRERIARGVRWRDIPYDDETGNGRIDPRTLSIELDELLPAERIVAVDCGNFVTPPLPEESGFSLPSAEVGDGHALPVRNKEAISGISAVPSPDLMGYPSMFLSVPDENGFYYTQAFQSVGLGLATAVGAALAQPDRLPVAALGDGGVLMSVAELETVVRLGLPMVIVIYDDEPHGTDVHHPGTLGLPVDIAQIARGFGCDAVTVRDRADLAGVAEWLKGPRDRPLVVHGKITARRGAWWLADA
jgi:thiamine pyrophosphate-dependent acetolactate synthase large subunit-like protein